VEDKKIFVPSNMQSPGMPYSYSPQKLLQNYKALKEQEESATAAAAAETEAAPSPNGRHLPGTFAVAAIQITASGLPNHDVQGFWQLAQTAVQDAAAAGANLILLPELFIGPYFCQSQEADLMGLAEPISKEHFMIQKMMQLAKRYQVVLPISLYERKNNALYNSIVMIDADGAMLGTYRKRT